MERYRLFLAAAVTALSASAFAFANADAGQSPIKEPVKAYTLVPQFLEYLKTDTDKQGERGIAMLDVLLEGAHWEEAETLAAQIVGFRKAIAFYKLAAARARAGQEELAARAYETGLDLPQGSLDHEVDEVFGARSMALSAMNKTGEAKEIAMKVFTPWIRVEALLAATEFGDVEHAEERALAFQKVEKANQGQMGRALLFAATTYYRAGDKDNARRLAVESAKKLSERIDDTTITTMLGCSDILAWSGDPDEAKRWVDVAFGIAQRLDNKAYWKPGELRRVAAAYRKLGWEEEAQAVFKLIPNAANKLDLNSASIGAADLAISFVERGEMDKFVQTCLVALKTIRQHVHHRARAMAALDVLSAHVRTGVPLSPDVQAALDDLAESILADPTYQNPV